MPERPNIIVLVLDTARADAFEPYGAPAGASPAFADVAGSGSLHEQMYAPACWTVPSHASIFTGLMPRAAGLIKAPGGRPAGCRPVLEAQRERLLPVVMASAGYETLAVSTNLWISPGSGFEIGFEHFDAVDGGRQASLGAGGMRDRGRWYLEAARARADDGADRAWELLERRLGSGDGRPFFAFVNLIEAHSPYLPPRPFNPLALPARLRSAAEARRHLTMDAIWRACAGGFDVAPEALERMRLLYAASILRLDAWLARLLEHLDASGRLGETLVIVTSDHGENLGEGGLMGHAFSLDQRLTRVPFAALGPGAPAGTGPAGLSELPRLICEAAGVELHPYAPSGRDGIAVAQFDPPAGPDDPRVERALRGWGLGEEAIPRFTSRLTSATDGRWKLVRRDESERFFDLAADPLELEPLAGGDLAASLPAAELRAAISGLTETPRPVPPGADVAGSEISDAEREDLEQRMRLLGYM